MLRRAVGPMSEVVNGLLRGDVQVVPPPMLPYFQDVYDHTLRAAEWTESLRELISTVLDTRLTLQSNRMNGIMKKVTSWAAIIAVPTAVTGFYGQNVPFPGSGAAERLLHLDRDRGGAVGGALRALPSLGLAVAPVRARFPASAAATVAIGQIRCSPTSA